MRFTSPPDDDRAVSPVIGVILMVAITVILATMVGSVFLDFAGQISEQPPQAAFEYEFDDEEDEVTVTHASGEQIDSSSLRILVDGTEAYPDEEGEYEVDNIDDTVEAGDSFDITYDGGGDRPEASIRIVWENPATDSANTLDSREWPGE